MRFIFGGFDGTAAFPIVTSKMETGITLFSYNPSVDSHWEKQVLANSAEAKPVGDCPTTLSQYEVPDVCGRKIQCHEQVNGTGTGFDLVQTRTGAIYAAWLEYAWDVDYALRDVTTTIQGSHLYTYYSCVRTETSGAGTTDLVVARLTDLEPVLSRFRLYAGDIQSSHSDAVAMTTRGDTLVIAAGVNHHSSGTGTVNAMGIVKYLEIDSTQLP